MHQTLEANPATPSAVEGSPCKAKEPGDLMCIDTFHIGNINGTGKLWQSTACDFADSCAMAKVASGNYAQEAASFLRDIVAVEAGTA